MKTSTLRRRGLVLVGALALATPASAEEHERTIPAEAITAEVIAMHTGYYTHRMDAFTDIIGESVLNLPDALFAVLEPKEQRRLCPLIVDHVVTDVTVGHAMRTAVFDRDGYHRVMKGTVLELAGFAPDDTGPWTKAQQQTIIEKGVGRLKAIAATRDALDDKFRHCLTQEIVEITDHGLTVDRADAESEALARALYQDLLPFLAWLADNLQPRTDPEASENLRTLLASVLTKYGPGE